MLPRRRQKNRSLIVALYVNAGLLASILIAMLARGGRSPFDGSMAFGQQVPQPIAGGGGFFLMPAQFGTNVWGCYVMDVDAQTLVAYRYNGNASGSGVGTLSLAAARSFVYDRQLKRYNTASPLPDEVRQIVLAERDQALNPDATTKPTIPQ